MSRAPLAADRREKESNPYPKVRLMNLSVVAQ